MRNLVIHMEESSDSKEQQLEEEEQEGEELEAQEQEADSEVGTERHYDDRPAKRSKGFDEDRISELPDSVISHILSLMPTTDAVKTSALSKRWHHIWTSTPSLVYIYENNRECLTKFIKFVDTTLILHRSPKIFKFVLILESGTKIIESVVHLWVHAAIIKQVEELTIKFRFDTCYSLPQSLYSCDSLTRLNLSYCLITPNVSHVCWRSLKHLSISDAPLEDNVLQKLLTGSPLLETLKLKDCRGFDRIDINSEKLRTLVINGYRDRNGPAIDWLEIDAPNLHSLEILSYMDMKTCRLKNVLSLVHADLTFCMGSVLDAYVSDDSDDEVYDDLTNLRRDMARDLLERVRHVPHLTIGTWIVQVLTICESAHLPSSTLMCKHLLLKINLCDFELPGIARLLQTSPILERLVIDMLMPLDDPIFSFEELVCFDGKDYWASKKDMVSQYLKIVEIYGFSDCTPEFVEFVLQYAKAMERLVLGIASGSNEEGQWYIPQDNLFKLVLKLLSFPRSSPNAQILVLQ